MGEKRSVGNADAFKNYVHKMGCGKENDAPEKCVKESGQFERCFKRMRKLLHDKCPKQMDAYDLCIYQHPKDLEFCRTEKEKFENACALSKR